MYNCIQIAVKLLNLPSILYGCQQYLDVAVVIMYWCNFLAHKTFLHLSEQLREQRAGRQRHQKRSAQTEKHQLPVCVHVCALTEQLVH